MTTDEKIDRLAENMEKGFEKLNTRIDEMDERLTSRMDRMDKRMDHMDERMDKMEENLTSRMDHMDERMDKMEENLTSRMDQMDERMDKMQETLEVQEIKLETEIEAVHQEVKSSYSKLDGRLSGVEGKLGEMQSDILHLQHETTGIMFALSSTEDRVKKVELMMENEIRPNLQILAEGYMSLNDKMSDAIKIRDDNLYYQVKVNTLGTKVSDLEHDVLALQKTQETQKNAG